MHLIKCYKDLTEKAAFLYCLNQDSSKMPVWNDSCSHIASVCDVLYVLHSDWCGCFWITFYKSLNVITYYLLYPTKVECRVQHGLQAWLVRSTFSSHYVQHTLMFTWTQFPYRSTFKEYMFRITLPVYTSLCHSGFDLFLHFSCPYYLPLCFCLPIAWPMPAPSPGFWII